MNQQALQWVPINAHTCYKHVARTYPKQMIDIRIGAQVDVLIDAIADLQRSSMAHVSLRMATALIKTTRSVHTDMQHRRLQ